MSQNLPDPHGGLGLVNRIIPDNQKKEFEESLYNKKVYTISDADLSMFYSIANGLLSPLHGPMDKKEVNRVLEEEVIERNGKKFAWTIPISFPIFKDEAEKMEIGETVAIHNEKGDLVGSLRISDIFYFDKDKYNLSVYGTDRKDHPGPRIVNDDSRDYLLGGEIWALEPVHTHYYEKYMYPPKETRCLFKEKGWERIVAFQTRNPLHRAHEYALIYGLETLIREGFNAGAVLNPLVGATKSDDVPADVRMMTYDVLIDKGIIGEGDRDDALWKEKGMNFKEHIMLGAMDVKMFYAGPKEAIMHAIYRQNFGFTDIIIGRQHADAPFDDGTPAWGDFDAQEIFNNLEGDLQIKPLNVGFAAFFEEINQVGLIEKYAPMGYHPVNISGKEVRRKLHAGEEVDQRIMRKPVADILMKFYMKKGE